MEIALKTLHSRKYHVTKTKKACKSKKNATREQFSTFIHKNKSPHSDTSILFCLLMAYNTNASLDKLTSSDNQDFGNCAEKLGRFSWYKIGCNYLDVNHKTFKKDGKKDFRLVQIFTMRLASFN